MAITLQMRNRARNFDGDANAARKPLSTRPSGPGRTGCGGAASKCGSLVTTSGALGGAGGVYDTRAKPGAAGGGPAGSGATSATGAGGSSATGDGGSVVGTSSSGSVVVVVSSSASLSAGRIWRRLNA